VNVLEAEELMLTKTIKKYLCMDIHRVKFYLFLAFGRCDHQLSCDILKTEFSDYEITWSNEGY
jgi:hypothetical protein